MRSEKKITEILKTDLPSGLVVFLVALPLCLGIALACKVNPFAGIIAGVVGGIIVGIISGSSLGVSGPAAGLTVIVLDGIKDLGTFEAFLLAVFLSGIIQIFLGIIRAGIIAYYFPSSVIKGMLAAIGIILILKQIPHALGYDADFEGDESFVQQDGQNTFTEIMNALKYHHLGAVIICLISLGLLLFFDLKMIRKYTVFKIVPGALFVVVIGALINLLFINYIPQYGLSGNHLVQLPVASSANEFFGFFTFPDFSLFGNSKIYLWAFTIAIVASLETLLCVEATDKLDPEKRITPTNRELFAQGAGNSFSGLIGGLPITQVIVRSSANINSGAQSKISTIFHGLLLLLCAVFIPAALNYIPNASLAAILLMVGYKLTSVKLYKSTWKLGWEQFVPFLVTIIAIVVTDLLKGIGIGLIIGLFLILRKNYITSHYLKTEREQNNNVRRIILSQEVSFLNKASLMRVLEETPEGTKLIIDGSNAAYIDYDVLEVINNYKKYTAPNKNIAVELLNINEIELQNHH